MAKKRITLKTANGQDSLYPRTAASQVEVTANTTLDTYMKGMVDSISDGTTVVVKKANEAVSLTDAPSLAASGTNKVTVTAGGKTSEAFTIPFATNATNATNANVANAIKDTNTGANKTWSDIDSLATAAAGTQWTDVGKVYVDQKISDLVAGDVTISIPQASEQDYGVSRLATLYDVQSQNDSSSNDASVAVTPNTLWRYLQSIKGENSGIASLDETGKVPSEQLPSYVDDVLEFANKTAFPTTGEGSKIYIDLATNKVYRWGGTTYVEVSSPLAIGETTGTAYDGAKGKANADAISALQTRVSTAEGEITSIKNKNESQDNSITAINNALYGSGNARKFVTLAEFNPVKLNADDVPALVTWKNQVSQRTEIDGDIVSVFSAIADGEGNDIASTYAKTTDIPDTSKFIQNTDSTTVQSLIGTNGLSYVEEGTVTY